MVKRAKGCAFGLLIGTLIRTMILVVEFLSRILAKILVLFGLWIPLIYAIFGVILYYVFHFNPFDFSLYSTLYLSGAAACVVSCLIISIRNIVLRPAKSVYEGYKHPLWERHREKNIEAEEAEFAEYVVKKRGEKLAPQGIDDFSTRKYRKKEVDYLLPATDFRPDDNDETADTDIISNENFAYNVNYSQNNNGFFNKDLLAPVIRAEKPKVYFSKLEPELLVHEYSDRFELFRIEHHRSVLDRVEYKE
ncbi:MAG TPA: hypothetical protein VJ903_04610 [Clostridia bacterium]|nr:hypothetical protein [Clostridia bacterium]